MAPKRRRVFPTTVRVDRISSLPDGILSHILSFLRTEELVRTRVLSTRWKHLFSLVPVLHFGYYGSSDSLSDTPDNPYERIKRFLDFVDWVFASYNCRNMVRFFFGYYEDFLDSSRLLSWINESVRRRVQELVLAILIREPQKLPQSIFTCGTITLLNIDGRANNCLILDVPEDVCLPRVRKIDLNFVSFADSDSARRLFRSCPVLEELQLQRTFSGDIYALDICVPTLKKLTIFGGYEDNFNFVLDVPNIENFYCSGRIREHGSISIESFKVLSKAGISFTADSFEGFKALENLVNAVCEVKKLQFDPSTLESYQESGRSLPLFCNLTSLEIENVSSINPEVLLDLLDRTPYLEVLEVANGFYVRDYDKSSHHIHFSGERVPACVSLHLKEVRFNSFQMLESEFKMVDYILKNAKVLNTFKIHFRGSLEKQVEMSKKLLALSRWSRACQIELDLVTEDLDMEDLDTEDEV